MRGMIKFLKRYWKWIAFLLILILPLGFVLGPIIIKYFKSRQAKKLEQAESTTQEP